MEQAWDFSDMRERKKEAERTGKENQMEGKAMGIQKQRKREKDRTVLWLLLTQWLTFPFPFVHSPSFSFYIFQ